MARKKASKKVSKKKVAIPHVEAVAPPVEPTEDMKALGLADEDLAERNIAHVKSLQENYAAQVAKKEAALIASVIIEQSSEENLQEVDISLPVRLKINRVTYNRGTHRVPRHVAQMMAQMADRKMRKDIEIFTGKNFMLDRLVNGQLKISEVDSLNLVKMKEKGQWS